SIGTVPSGRLDEPEHRHLDEVVALDASSPEAPRESDREPAVGDHDLLADARRAGGVGLLAGPPELERGVTIALTVVAGLITDDTGHGHSSYEVPISAAVSSRRRGDHRTTSHAPSQPSVIVQRDPCLGRTHDSGTTLPGNCPVMSGTLPPHDASTPALGGRYAMSTREGETCPGAD